MGKDTVIATNDLGQVLEVDSHPSNIDNMVRKDMDFEGDVKKLPPVRTNPLFGAEGNLAEQIIHKTK